MKKICLSVWIFFNCISFLSHSQPPTTELVRQDDNSSEIRFRLSDFHLQAVQTSWGTAHIPVAEGATPHIKTGAPAVPKFSTSIVIPDLARMGVEVIKSQYTDYSNIAVAPSKGFLLRNQDPTAVPYVKGIEYTRNVFYPGNLVSMNKPYILRDLRGQTLLFFPFQYNPKTKILRVYDEMIVRVYKIDDQGVNPFHRSRPFLKVQTDFLKTYKRHFLNYDQSVSRYAPVEEQGNMLIISYGTFIDALAPFIYWKKQKGISVEVADVATIGNASAIESYIANYYNNNGLAFVLLVGDAQYVPCSMTSAGDSDNKYGYITGNDSYPELIVGRFSCETTAEVQTMVDRVIRYEKTPPTSGNWYASGIGLGSDQGPGDDNELDFEHIRNIRTDLLGYTYNTVFEFYDGSQGGNDASGNPTQSMVGDAINNGVGVINYCGHGSDNAFVTSGFSSNDVDQLTNVNKYPFIFSVACVNGNFVGQTCFAETWLRATHNNTGEPTGAIGAMMSTINQYWDPPMDGQDEMNDILTEMYSYNIKHTFGGIALNGCLQMNDDYGQQGYDMTDTWTIFGDPSVTLRTAVPGNMTVSHPATLNTGATSALVYCNIEGAVICLMQDSNILGTGVISGGNINITFPALTSMSDITVTATAFNQLPYFGTIAVNPVGILHTDLSAEGLLISPNPASDMLSITYNLSQTEHVKITLFNALGERITVISDEIQQAGWHNIRKRIGMLPDGLYFLSFSNIPEKKTKKLLIVK